MEATVLRSLYMLTLLALVPKQPRGRKDLGHAPALHMPPPGKCFGLSGLKWPDRSSGPTAPVSPIPSVQLLPICPSST